MVDDDPLRFESRATLADGTRSTFSPSRPAAAGKDLADTLLAVSARQLAMLAGSRGRIRSRPAPCH
jgi:hypothetical protein